MWFVRPFECKMQREKGLFVRPSTSFVRPFRRKEEDHERTEI